MNYQSTGKCICKDGQLIEISAEGQFFTKVNLITWHLVVINNFVYLSGISHRFVEAANAADLYWAAPFYFFFFHRDYNDASI